MRIALAAALLAPFVSGFQETPQERAVKWVAENNTWGTAGQLVLVK